MKNGGKLNLPIYYRNKLFTEEEREKLFLDKIEKGIIYVLGTKIDLKNKRIIPNEKRWKTQPTNLLQKQTIYRRQIS